MSYQRHFLPHFEEAKDATAYYKAGYPTEISGLYLCTRPEDRMLSYQSSQLLVIHTRISVLQVDAGCIDVCEQGALSNLQDASHTLLGRFPKLYSLARTRVQMM